MLYTEKYHTYENHIKPMLDHIDETLHLNGNGGEEKKLILRLAAIFHDIVYNPMSKTNEEDSVTAYDNYLKNGGSELYENYVNSNIVTPEVFKFLSTVNLNELYKHRDKVIELIMNTKDTFNSRSGDELGHYFYLMDTYILRENFSKLLEYEHQIYNEYKNFYTVEEYKKGRVEFLQKCISNIQNVNTVGLEKVISYVQNRNYGTVGIFAGSFNPFHIGHMNILKQAQKDFDKVIVVQMQDFNKPKNIYEMPTIDTLDCYVTTSNKLLSEVFNEYKQGHTEATIIRALRNGDDLQHEQNLRNTVRDFDKNVRFTYYLADTGFSHISSTLVRSLPDGLKGRYMV